MPKSLKTLATQKPRQDTPAPAAPATYGHLLGNIDTLLLSARHHTARAVNACMTATYWHVGRHIVEFEQRGADRAKYGESLLQQLANDLTAKNGRGFSKTNLFNARLFYLTFDAEWVYKATTCKVSAPIFQTLSGKSQNPILQTLSAKYSVDSQHTTPLSTPTAQPTIAQHDGSSFDLSILAKAFPLPWSHYVMLISRGRSPEAREFYHAEALRGGWSVRQLDRQISTLFYERVALSKNKTAMLQKAAAEQPRPDEILTPDEEIREPLCLEFLNLRDEYSETELEDALIRHLETFLLELGNDFTFVGRQRRLRIGNEWFRVDLLFFHRRLRSLVVIDLKVGKFTHTDAGQMNLYLNYAREHRTQPAENPPVGLILCSEKNDAVARYALEGLENKIQAREYKLALPAEKLLAAEIAKAATRLRRRQTPIPSKAKTPT